jgi:hypothetical protein
LASESSILRARSGPTSSGASSSSCAPATSYPAENAEDPLDKKPAGPCVHQVGKLMGSASGGYLFDKRWAKSALDFLRDTNFGGETSTSTTSVFSLGPILASNPADVFVKLSSSLMLDVEQHFAERVEAFETFAFFDPDDAIGDDRELADATLPLSAETTGMLFFTIQHTDPARMKVAPGISKIEPRDAIVVSPCHVVFCDMKQMQVEIGLERLDGSSDDQFLLTVACLQPSDLGNLMLWLSSSLKYSFRGSRVPYRNVHCQRVLEAILDARGKVCVTT